jgi:hypothetical protein
MQFKSLEALEAYARRQMEDIAKTKLNKKITRLLREYTTARVYHARTPVDYRRTYEFLNSITAGDVISNGNSISCSIYFDPDKMRQIDGSHMSIYGYTQDRKFNAPINEMLPYYLNYGTESPVFSFPKANFLEETYRVLNAGSFRRELITFLKQRGIAAR